MILQQELFQKLVDRIIEDIGYNINIIDVDGYIVASGLTKRIGTFHEIGYEAAIKEERIDITEEVESKYEGVHAGVNQPFYYKGKLLGVIGITGKEKEINDLVNVVKSMIELMVEQELLKERMFYRQSNKAYFANLLLNIKTNEDKATLRRVSKKLGYDLEVPRCMIVVSFGGKYDDHAYGDILKEIKQLEGHTSGDFSTMIGSDQLIILKRRIGFEDVKDKLAYNQSLIAYGNRFVEAVEALGVKQVFVGIGSVYNELDEHVNGYKEAMFCVEKLRKMSGDKSVASIYDFMMEYASSFLPQGFIDHFVYEYFHILKEQTGLLETIIALAKNHMNIVETAKDLYLHRNTVIFRVNKIKELTGLDPIHNYNDRILTHLISGYYYNHKNELSKNI